MLHLIKTLVAIFDGSHQRRSTLRARAAWSTHCNREVSLQLKRDQVRFSLSLTAMEFQRRWAISQGRLLSSHAK